MRISALRSAGRATLVGELAMPEVVQLLLTALQVDGTEALQVPKFVAVDFADTVLELLTREEVGVEVVECLELLAREELGDVVELLDMAARWI